MFDVYAIYPVNQNLPPEVYPGEACHKGTFKTLRGAKGFQRKLDKTLKAGGGIARAVIVNGGVELSPNRYGRYEGYE